MIEGTWALKLWIASWLNDNAVCRGQNKQMERGEPYIVEAAFDLDHFAHDLMAAMEAPE